MLVSSEAEMYHRRASNSTIPGYDKVNIDSEGISVDGNVLLSSISSA